MNLSAPFIRRPVATSLIALALVLGGMVAFFLLPVSPLPQTDSPTITIQTSFPGASPETMSSSVATPLERSLGHIAGIKEMTSSSVTGSSRITIQFDLDRDIEGAAGDVQAAINAARHLLPPNLPRNPVYHKVNPADAPIMILALTSDTRQQGELYDAASTVLTQQLSQIEGIGQVVVGGSSLPAVRIELNPDALVKYGISMEEVRGAIEAVNPDRPKGTIDNGSYQWQLDVNDRSSKAKDYLPLIIAHHDGIPVRLSDVGNATDSVEDIRNAGSSNGKPSVLLILYKQPGANIIKTVEQIIATLPQLRSTISPAIDLAVTMDRTTTIRASLHEAEQTLLIAVALVVAVVFLFLRQGRATLIPAIAVPLSLIGTFAIMYFFGYSIDNISLMALIVATGFVVDDAVVVLENSMRHLEGGHLSPIKAALRSVREVGATVVSMSLSLVAVFIPILLMGGVVGRLFREFAVTLSGAVMISLAVSLSVTPVMCAYLLKRPLQPGKDPAYVNSPFGRMHDSYKTSLVWVLERKPLILFLFLCTIALNVYLYVIIPKGFFPQQDTGRLNGTIQADQKISFQSMRHKLDGIIDIIRSDPAVDNVVGFTGESQHDTGTVYIALKSLAGRGIGAEDVIARLDKKLAAEPGVRVYLQAAQEVHIGGRQSSAQYQYTVQADDLNELHRWAPRISRLIGGMPMLGNVVIDQKDKGEQTHLVVDRDTLYELGLTMSLVDSTLYDAFGQRLVSNIFNPLNEYHVIMEVAPQYWQSSSSLKQSYVEGPKKEAIPLSVFSHYENIRTLLSVHHEGEFPAATISFNLKPGVSIGEASAAITKELKKLNLPNSIHGSFQGTARAFEESLKNQPFLILVALVTIYIVLGVLYESYIHPLTILSTLPSAGTGALLALLLFRTEFTIIAFIGVILLIGIVKKNAIMMIDLALEIERKQGKSPAEAIFEACLLRFRPIMMTTLVALFGVLPLAIGVGDGAELRQPLGISIVGGLIVSQMLTLYTTPVVYLYFDALRRRWQRKGSMNTTSLMSTNA